MLKMIHNMSELNFAELMAVYEEANRENGRELYADESENQQLLLAEQDFYNYLRNVFFVTPGAVYALWVPDGSYVAALRLEPYADGLLLAALETRPDARRKGNAENLINAVITYLIQRGSGKVYSHISKRNVPSIGVHNKCGFQIIKDHAVYADGSVMYNNYTFCREF